MPREMPEVTKINVPNPAHLRAITLPVSEGAITILPINNVLLCISAQGENFFPSFYLNSQHRAHIIEPTAV